MVAKLSTTASLEHVEERFRLLVENVVDYGIFMLTPDGCVDSWNMGAERLKGYRRDEILGKHFSIFYPPEDIASGKCERELDVATRVGRFEDEGWRLRKDGSRFWANVVITALKDKDGTLTGFAKVTRDLTERRHAEERLRTLAAEKAVLAEKARVQEFQERFVGILGHDLRGPLSAIDMAASLLSRQPAWDASSVRLVERIASSSRRMARMISQILDLTRTRLGEGFTINARPVELAALLDGIIEEVVTAHPERRVTLRCPSITGAWDKDRLDQVFSNIIGNAVQHGTEGMPITVTGSRSGDNAVVLVHNRGPTIPPSELEHLFDPFRRGASNSTSMSATGLGLGLYISREIARAHGGDVACSSNDEDGITLRVTLPLHGAHADVPPRSIILL